MNRKIGFYCALVAGLLLFACENSEQSDVDQLREGFISPPLEARPRALWDWVDGNFQLEEITREMEEAKRMGMGGFDIWDVRSVVDEAGIVPAGPSFMGEKSVEAICFAINEAERLELDLGLIIASGWNAGGAWTLPEHQTMGLFDSRLSVSGPGEKSIHLAFPELPLMAGKKGREKKAFIPLDENGLPEFYTEVAVLAWPVSQGAHGKIDGSVIDLGGKMDTSGLLTWDVPEGEWTVVRYICTNTGQPMISSTPNSHGPMIDHFNAEASERHINYFIEKLEKSLGKPIGESGLSYFYTDSYEVQGQLWTPTMAAEFQERMGYNMIPYLPVLEGITLEDPEISRRFMYDFRRVLSDLIIENHYQRTREICEAHGVGFVAEAAGPGMPLHNCPFESLLSSGSLSFPRGEFWHIPENSDFWSGMEPERKKHYQIDNQVIKGVASASHIYNRKYVEAEAFTGTHLWNEGPGDLKPTADRAFCEGLNRINFHTWPHTPEEAGTPGWAYAFGTLINENRIWWPMAKPFMDYLGRCSYMLQQGNFVGDVLFYYGDSVPNFVPAKHLIEGLGFGYDYDVCNSDILLNQLMVEDGRLVLSHGQSYALLVLPDERYMQPEILEKVGNLVEAGATVVGPKPERSHGLYNWKQRDQEVRDMAEKLWGNCDGKSVSHKTVGKGEVFNGEELRSILMQKGIGPDFDFSGSVENSSLDFIHRSYGDADIYFIRNSVNMPVSGSAFFRQRGKKAEYWDPASGLMYEALAKDLESGIELALQLDARGSIFVVLSPVENGEGTAQLQPGHPPVWFQDEKIRNTKLIEGPWLVNFPEASAGAGQVVFDSLISWNKRSEDGIRFFSGIATYENEFEWDAPGIPDDRIFLELSDVVEVAKVFLNGEELAILWKKPFRVEISDKLKPGVNSLRIDVANTWANGLAGDARLPKGERRTRTNVTRLPNAWTYPFETIPREEYDLIPAGLSGKAKIITFKTH